MSEQALSAVLGLEAPPALTAEQVRQVEQQVENERWGRVRREIASSLPSQDAAIINDLPLGAVRELFPGRGMAPSPVDEGVRTRAARAQRRSTLMGMLHDALSGTGEQADATWQRLLRGSGSAGLLEVAPTPATARNLGTQALTAHTVRTPGLWQTVFYDSAPQATARALNVDIVVVTDDGVQRHTDPQATGGTLYVHYDGGAHYQTMGTGRPEPTTAVDQPTTDVAGSASPERTQRATESPFTSHLIDLATRYGAGSDLLQRLRGLSPQAAQTLEPQTTRQNTGQDQHAGETEDSEDEADAPDRPGPGAPPDLTPAPGTALDDVYPVNPAVRRDWTTRVMRAAEGSVGFYWWRGASQPVAGDDGWAISEHTSKGATNDFGRWILGNGPVPKSGSTLNCREAFLFTAYWSGAVNKVWLQEVHQNAADTAEDAYFDALDYGLDDDLAEAESIDLYYRLLLEKITTPSVTRHRFDPDTGQVEPEIPPGHLVLFNQMAHVALALGTYDDQGRQEVLSH